MKIFPYCFFVIVCFFPPLLMADEAFLNARTAFQKKDFKKFEKWRKQVQEPKLERYLESWFFQFTLTKNAQSQEVLAFLKRYENSVVAEKFRRIWLSELVRQKAWTLILEEFPNIKKPTDENFCAFEKAKIESGKPYLLKNSAQVHAEWFKHLNPQFSCSLFLEDIFNTQNISQNAVIERARLQIEQNKIGAAQKTLKFFKSANSFWMEDVQRALNDSLRFLAKLPNNWAENNETKILTSFALARYVTKDFKQALPQFLKLEKQLDQSDQTWIWAQIALQSAKLHQKEALTYFQKAAQPLNNEALQWYARSALRAQNWALLKDIILKMPDDLANQSVWIYWLGRAYDAEQNNVMAQTQYRKIAGHFHYYANLAQEEMGQEITIPAQPPTPLPNDILQMELNEDIQRALLLFKEDVRPEAVEEWVWAIQNFDDSKLLAAAFLAKKHQIWDRTINTALKTQKEHHFPLRFIAPFKNIIEIEANKQNLDIAWVYGLMRQESRFITSAKSYVGASGLMQLMPSTAKWVAKKIGLKNYHPQRVNEHDVNVLLGTSYMRMVLDDLDNHPLLASAAYNAGPGRAKRWRANIPLEGAIYAETIPFNETRDYVQKVLNNAVYYSILFHNKPDSLKKRLGIVMPKTNDTRSNLP